MRMIIAPCAAFIGLLAASGATADTFEVDRGALGYRAGIETTLRRIDQFTDQACGASGRVGLYALRAERECKDGLAAEIIADIDGRRLHAVAADQAFAAKN